MKFLITWSWKGTDSKEVSARFREWQPVGDVKFLFPIHTLIGARKAFAVTEGTDIETMAKNVQPWTDVCKYEISPIIDSRELMALLAEE
ncbi:MAG: DUF3303 family protein [Candidatus Bathyarchaeota archaeon]|nr:MAG: DUF3303 family protein [Candidatus Bathyarchaeota archaeon]